MAQRGSWLMNGIHAACAACALTHGARGVNLVTHSAVAGPDRPLHRTCLSEERSLSLLDAHCAAAAQDYHEVPGKAAVLEK